MIAKITVKKDKTLVDEFMCYAKTKDTLVDMIYKEKEKAGFSDRVKYESIGRIIKEELK